MASASTKNTTTFVPDLEAAGDRFRAANDRFLEAGVKVTNAYLDGVERYVAGVAQFERKLGEQSQVEVVSSLISAHAKMTEDLTKAGVAAARELITA